MTTFSIDSENAITRYDSAAEVPEGAVLFATEGQLNALAQHWPGARLVDVWNGIPGVEPVRKFTSRSVAARRIWAALQPGGSEKATKGSSKPARKKGRGAAKSAGTKTEHVIALLRRPNGATLQALMSATGWQAHSIRGFISAQLGKRMGLRVKSFTREGERVYKIRS